MPTKSRPFAKLIALGSAAAIVGIAVFASRASSSTTPLEREFRTAYPRTPEVTGTVAGVQLGELSFGAYRLLAREDHAIHDGGVILSYGDAEVRLVVELAVAADSAGARRFVDDRLHAVSNQQPSLGDGAYGDYAFGDGDAFAIGAAQNVAWVVRALDGSAVRAKEVVTELRKHVVAGAPTFPTATITLAPEIPLTGGELQVAAPGRFSVRAEGGYVAHGKSGPVLKPFGAGKVTAIVTSVDDLGRVSETRAVATAK
jgi:hypothetical protein